jgi:hypothetical protein
MVFHPSRHQNWSTSTNGPRLPKLFGTFSSTKMCLIFFRQSPNSRIIFSVIYKPPVMFTTCMTGVLKLNLGSVKTRRLQGMLTLLVISPTPCFLRVPSHYCDNHVQSTFVFAFPSLLPLVGCGVWLFSAIPKFDLPFSVLISGDDRVALQTCFERWN